MPTTPHDPLATPATCPGCADPFAPAYDHEAVRKARPPDFDRQVRAHVETIARGAPWIFGIALHPDAGRKARRWLRENGQR